MWLYCNVTLDVAVATLFLVIIAVWLTMWLYMIPCHFKCNSCNFFVILKFCFLFYFLFFFFFIFLIWGDNSLPYSGEPHIVFFHTAAHANQPLHVIYCSFIWSSVQILCNFSFCVPLKNNSILVVWNNVTK